MAAAKPTVVPLLLGVSSFSVILLMTAAATCEFWKLDVPAGGELVIENDPMEAAGFENCAKAVGSAATPDSTPAKTVEPAIEPTATVPMLPAVAKCELLSAPLMVRVLA